MNERLTLRGYYDLSLAAVLTWLFLLTWASETVSHWVLIPSAVYCLSFCFEKTRRLKWVQKLPFWFFLTLVGLSVQRYSEDKDIVWISSYAALGLLPIVLKRKELLSGYWTSIVGIIFLALIDLLAGDSLAEFLFFIALSSTLVFSLNAAHLYFYVGTAEASVRRVPPHYFFPFVGSVALGLCVGGALFILFPRALQWQNPLGMRNKAAVTGYSGSVSLNGVSINESQAVAIQVQASDSEWLRYQAPFILFRGNTLDRFDGVRWWASQSNRHPYLSPVDLQFTSSFERRFIQLRMYRELHSTPAVFLTGAVHDAVFPRQRMGPLKVDGSGNLTREGKGDMRYAYVLSISPTRRPRNWTDLTRRDLRAMLAQPQNLKHSFARSPEEFSRYLQLPPDISNHATFKAWSEEVYGRRPPENIARIFSTLHRHFQENFRAGYESAANNIDSLTDFIKKGGRYGHCEFFASASVLLLRSLGIPARLALGYRGGSFNTVSQVLEVREANAHAWVEAYVPNMGWVTYDPTPVMTKPLLPGWSERVRHYAAAVRFWLNRYLVDYNSQVQAGLFAGLRQSAFGSRQTASFRIRDWLVPLLGAVLVLLSVILGRSSWRGWASRHRATLPSYYQEFEKRLRSLGWTRQVGETYQQFHLRLKESGKFSGVLDSVAQALESDLLFPTSHESLGKTKTLCECAFAGLAFVIIGLGMF